MSTKHFRIHAVALAALALVGCGDGGGSGPAMPPGPDLTTIEGALQALEDYYGLQQSANAIALLAGDYRFVPAHPEAIGFLGPGETEWDRAKEVEILELLLVPERISWIDIVLLEIEVLEITPIAARAGGEAYDVRAEVDLGIGDGLYYETSSAEITFRIRKDGEGLFKLHEERETEIAGAALTVSENKVRVLEETPRP